LHLLFYVAFTVPLAKAVGPYGQVHAFEPQRIISQRLQANIAINDLENVYVYNVAVGNQTGTIRMPYFNYSSELNFGYLSLLDDFGSSLSYSVPLVTLDSIEFLNVFTNSSCPSLMKIDVEQMELHVLQGGRQLISSCRPIIYAENNKQESSAPLISIISELDYVPYWHVTPCYNDANYKDTHVDISDGWIDVNIICIPSERLDMLHPQPMKMVGFIRIDVDRPYLHQYYSEDQVSTAGIPISSYQN